jgi:hypothetical protein
LPTVSLSTVWDITLAVKPPRPCFLDFPIGCPVGKPGMPEMQRQILKAVFAQAEKFTGDWALHELPFQWAKDGSRHWEEELKDLYRRGLGTVEAHVADHRRRGEALIGQEEAFALRCNC